MQIIRSLSEMQKQAEAWRSHGLKIGLVPTMGFLHDGHLSLVRLAKSKTDRSVVSIFVNPTQFGPKEDLSRYPRDEAGDLEKLESEKVDAVFLPTADEMYPEGFQTTVHLGPLTQGLCGKSRPGHFDGVATVVLKLLDLVKPQVAVFGEKDYQQLAVIRQMAKDLNLDLEILGAPTTRNEKGLALSSRNSYLSEKELTKAIALSQAIARVQDLFRQGEKKTRVLMGEAQKIFRAHPEVELEYLEIVDATSLEPLKNIDRPARFLIAARVGKTRLIDNGPVQTK